MQLEVIRMAPAPGPDDGTQKPPPLAYPDYAERLAMRRRIVWFGLMAPLLVPMLLVLAYL